MHEIFFIDPVVGFCVSRGIWTGESMPVSLEIDHQTG
jgi:hypothetical protein